MRACVRGYAPCVFVSNNLSLCTSQRKAMRRAYSSRPLGGSRGGGQRGGRSVVLTTEGGRPIDPRWVEGLSFQVGKKLAKVGKDSARALAAKGRPQPSSRACRCAQQQAQPTSFLLQTTRGSTTHARTNTRTRTRTGEPLSGAHRHTRPHSYSLNPPPRACRKQKASPWWAS